MSSDSLIFSAVLAPVVSGPRVRIGLILLVRNDGSDVCHIPDPLRSSRTLTLRLKRASGGERIHVIGDEPPIPGVRLLPINRAVPPRGEVNFEMDLAHYFEIPSGRYSLNLDYRFGADEVWHSPPIHFERLAPAGTYLTVMAAEAAGYGYHAVLWLERRSQRLQAVMFDDDGSRRDVEDAQVVSDDIPIISDAAMSQYPAGQPYTEYWVAWVAAAQLCIRFYAHGDPSLALPQSQHPLPEELSGVRLIHPLLADRIPREGRPPCTIGMLSSDQRGNHVLSIVRLTTDGNIAGSAETILPGRTVGAWAISPHADERLFVLALQTNAGLEIVAYSSDAKTLLGAMRLWHTAGQSTLLAGDVRADLEGRTFVGLLVSSGGTQMRVTFAVSGPSLGAVTLPQRDPVAIPSAAEILCARLDGIGRLHIVHSILEEATPLGAVLYHLAPSEPAATSRIERFGAIEPWSVRLIVRPNSRPYLVGYDADTGPFLHRI
jgi:hypothetical protein